MIDILIVLTTASFVAFLSHAMWKARRRESTQPRRVVDLALCGAASIFLANLVQLALLLGAGDSIGGAAVVTYWDTTARIVLAVGIALLAISLLDMVVIGNQLRPRPVNSPAIRNADGCAVAESNLEPAAIPAVLFRREAPLGNTGVSSVFLNDAVHDLLGFSREEMQSDPHFITWLMHPEDRQDFLAGDDRLVGAGAQAKFDHRLKHRNGSYRWIRTVLKRIDDQTGTFKEIVGCCLDVTDLKEAEEELTAMLRTDPCDSVPDGEAT